MAGNFACIEVGEYFIKVLDAEKKENQMQIESIGMIKTDDIFFSSSSEKSVEDQGIKLHQALKQIKSSKRNVNIIIPDSLSYNQIIEIAKLNEKELLSAIKYQADQFIPMPIEEVSLDVEILHEFEQESKILALISAAPIKTIERIQKMAEYAGLIPYIAEVEISAASRFLSEIYKGESALFINMGYGTSTFYYYNQQLGLVSQAHNFAIGLHLFIKAIQSNLNLSLEQTIENLKAFHHDQKADNLDSVLAPAIKDFLSEIQRFINSVADKYQARTQKIYFFGEAVRFSAILQLTEKFLNIPVTMFDPSPYIKNVQSVESMKSDLPLFISALGGNLR